MTFADYIKRLEVSLETDYAFVDSTYEIDDTVTIRTPCIYCNLSGNIVERVLVIESIRVIPPRLQRTGLGLGTNFVTKLIRFAEAESLFLQAANVSPSAYGFWEHRKLGFTRLAGKARHWQRFPVPDSICLMDVSSASA